MVGLIPLIILILDRLKLYKFLRSENWGFFYEILDNRKVHLKKFFLFRSIISYYIQCLEQKSTTNKKWFEL